MDYGHLQADQRHVHSLVYSPECINSSPLKDLTQAFEASVQFSSVAQSCPILCDPMDGSTSGLPVHHQLPEFGHTQDCQSP